ncbi:MAG: hypothetical protein J4473_03765 [Candidatus Aenigmarchaeota archaeon]|nr:hypothetical protein [Candidatus Aenigmarchaeota archaeon]
MYNSLLMSKTERYENKRSFIGIPPYDRIPIDMVQIALTGRDVPLTILIADEFQIMNGMNPENVKKYTSELQKMFDRLSLVYDIDYRTMLCSDFMHGSAYRDIHEDMRNTCNGLHKELFETVPEKRRNDPDPMRYALNELACMRFMAENGFEAKVGPEKELQYDSIAEIIGIYLDYYYLSPAYSLGTRYPVSVVHYVPTDRKGGQRIMIDDELYTIKARLMLGPKNANMYFCQMGNAAAEALGNQTEEYLHLSERWMKKRSVSLVLNNIIKPLRGELL